MNSDVVPQVTEVSMGIGDVHPPSQLNKVFKDVFIG